MTLAKSTAAKTAVTDHPILKAAEQRIDVRDAISAADKPSQEQALVEAAVLKAVAGEVEAALASQDFRPVGSDFSRLDVSLLDSAKDAGQDTATDFLALAPESAFAGQQGISFEDAIAMMAGGSGDFFVENFPAQAGQFVGAAEGAPTVGNDAQVESGQQRPATDWEAIRTNVWGLPTSEFDSDEPPPQQDKGAIANTGANPTGTTLAPSVYDDEGLKPGGSGEVAKEYGNGFLGSVANAFRSDGGSTTTGAGQVLDCALDNIDNIGNPSADSTGKSCTDPTPRSNGTTVVYDAGPDDNGNPTTMTVWTSEDGKVEITTTSWGDTILYNANTNTTTTIYKDGSTKTTDHNTGETTTTDSLECQPDGEEELSPEEKARLHETIGKELHIPRPGEAQADGDVDYGEDGAPVEVSGPGVDMEAVKDFLIGQPAGPDGALGGAGGETPFRPDPEAGGEIDPTDDALTSPQGAGPEDDPLDQGPQVETDPASRAGTSSEDDGGAVAIDLSALDLRRADDPGTALRNVDLDLLQQQSEPVFDIVPDFGLEPPLPGLDLGNLFGQEAFV